MKLKRQILNELKNYGKSASMKGEYISYYGNVYKIKRYSDHKEALEVELIKQNNQKLCKDEEHAKWLAQGDMWPNKFFDRAKIIHNGELLYGKK